MRPGASGFLKTKQSTTAGTERGVGGSRKPATCAKTLHITVSPRPHFCACKGILRGVLLGVEGWGHSPFRTCFPFHCKEDLASSKSHIPWDSTQNQRRCGFSVMLGCPPQSLIQRERKRRKGKEMATGTTPRQRHTSETTLHRNPSESPLSCQEAGTGQWGARGTLPVGRTNRRPAPGPCPSRRAPVTSGLPDCPDSSASPAQSEEVRGSVYLGHPNPHHEHPVPGPRRYGRKEHDSGCALRRPTEQALRQPTRALTDQSGSDAGAHPRARGGAGGGEGAGARSGGARWSESRAPARAQRRPVVAFFSGRGAFSSSLSAKLWTRLTSGWESESTSHIRKKFHNLVQPFGFTFSIMRGVAQIGRAHV